MKCFLCIDFFPLHLQMPLREAETIVTFAIAALQTNKVGFVYDFPASFSFLIQ